MSGEDLAALIDRMVPLFIDKLRNNGHAPLTDDWWECVVGTCIADTSIALANPDYIDRWEQELQQPRTISPPGSGLDGLLRDIERVAHDEGASDG